MHAPTLRAASRHSIDRLSQALLALLDPPSPPAAVPSRPVGGGYAVFDVPTYQRRGIRIEELEAPRTATSR